MIEVHSNASEVFGAISQAIDTAAKVAGERSDSIHKMVSSSVSRHFRLLEWGGGDSTAIGLNVSWITHRDGLTIAEREARDEPMLPLLSMSHGASVIEDAYTAHAESTSQAAGSHGSSFSYSGGGDPFAVGIGSINQRGDWEYAKFNRIGKTAFIKFPERPFLYWDTQMRDELLGMVRNAFSDSIQRGQT